MTPSSGVLIVGKWTRQLPEVGADTVADFKQALQYLRTRQPSILVFGSGAGLKDFCEQSARLAPNSIWLVNSERIPPSQLIDFTNFGRLYDLIDGFDDPELENKIHAGLESSGLERQRRELAGMFEEQSQRLKRLQTDLEARVDKRHKTLRKSMKTLDATKIRLEAFHKALLGIHRASTVFQMEQSLNEALHEALGMEWVRVRFANQSALTLKSGKGILSIAIPFRERDPRLNGEVVYCKTGSFTNAEVDFLHELTEALALALSRLYKLEQAETLKVQWQATFDSIPHALCLTTADFEILKLNKAFQQLCQPRSFRGLIGKNCFHAFFGPEFQPPAKASSPFTFRNSRTGPDGTEHYEVTCESLGLPIDNQAVQLVLMRSITGEVRFERRIFEASKLAELGTIGSSIAHELNNPLGGMLSFLQLILMDLKSVDEHYSEIKQMEAAVLRCRDIVQNLLSFARRQDPGEFSEVDLNQVIERAVKLTELQSKSMGVKIEVEPAQGQAGEIARPATIVGNVNSLSQALCNLLQNSIDAISEKVKADPLFSGRIVLGLDHQQDRTVLRITDNGSGIRPEFHSQIFNPLFTTRAPESHSGMGLTVAFSIVTDHRGTLEILSQHGSGTSALLAFPAAKKGH